MKMHLNQYRLAGVLGGLLLAAEGRKPAGRDRFRALMLGQFLNLLVFRIGDLARVASLEGQRLAGDRGAG